MRPAAYFIMGKNTFQFTVYALLQFVIQLGVSVRYGSFFVDRQAAAVGLSMSTFATLALYLSPPICVFSMRSAADFRIFCSNSVVSVVPCGRRTSICTFLLRIKMIRRYRWFRVANISCQTLSVKSSSTCGLWNNVAPTTITVERLSWRNDVWNVVQRPSAFLRYACIESLWHNLSS